MVWSLETWGLRLLSSTTELGGFCLCSLRLSCNSAILVFQRFLKMRPDPEGPQGEFQSFSRLWGPGMLAQTGKNVSRYLSYITDAPAGSMIFIFCWWALHKIMFTYYILTKRRGKWVWYLLRFLYTCAMDTHAHVCLYMYVYTNMNMYVCMNIHEQMYKAMCACMCVHSCAFTCICMYTAAYECTCGTGAWGPMNTHTYMHVCRQYALVLPTKVVIFQKSF